MPVSAVTRFVGRVFQMRYTRHAADACLSDRYGLITPPTSIRFSLADIIEVETNNFGVARKLVVRLSYNDKLDICLVIIPDGVEGIVKTVWINEKNDKHVTLRREIYAKN
jgi:hypothetical protein